MDEHDRFRREHPARSGPNRNFKLLYESPAQSNRAPHSNSDPKAAPNGREREDAYSGGVGLAYQVIDQYIAAGRNAAEQFNRQFYNLDAGGDELQPLIERLLRFQSEIAPIWLDMIANLVRIDPRAAATASPNSYGGMQAQDRAGAVPNSTRKTADHPSSSNAVNAPVLFTLEISSRRPVEVSVRLELGAERTAVVCAGLLSPGPGKPPITDVKIIEERDGRPKIHVAIPPDQPPGVYSGVVVERRSGNPCGTLSVRVSGPSGRTSRHK